MSALDDDPGATARIDGTGALHVGWGDGDDWLGPGTPLALDGVDATVTTGQDNAGTFVVLSLEATRAVSGFATGSLTDPSVGWSFRPDLRSPGGIPEGTTSWGFSYTEFGLPVRTDASLAFFPLLPWRPNIVEPLGLTAPDGRTLLLAPLDGFHEQVVVVPSGGHGTDLTAPATTWGWHGDLDEAPEGFTTRLAILTAASPREALDRLGTLLQDLHGTLRPAADADAMGRSLSYWTDNGAAYWYKTEPGHDVTSTITTTVQDLHDRGIPAGPVQLDSWFYPHEVLRPFDTDDWIVPPTGLLRWEPREDILPDGLAPLIEQLGSPPMAAHCRHLSSSSPYLDAHDCWVDADRAHPKDVGLYERYLDSCRTWGIDTFEHDWLIECFLGVRGLRAGANQARDWQEGVDRAAAERGITLQWCMASPADILQTVTLSQVTSIRTSGDHGYLVPPGFLFSWFLCVNALARSLDLRPFKDVFLADTSKPEKHSHVEALLSALSTGPVGIGDPLGKADAALVAQTCRADGTLVRPDVPIAALGSAFTIDPTREQVLLFGECFTDHPAGRWSHVVGINCHRDGEPIADEVRLDALGDASLHGPSVAFDLRAGTATPVDPTDTLGFALGPLDWGHVVVAPVLSSGLALLGDGSLFAPSGHGRLGTIADLPDRVRATVLGGGETVTISGWAPSAPTARAWAPIGGWTEVEVTWDVGQWAVTVTVPAAGTLDLEVVAG